MQKKILLIIPKLSNGGIERVASNFSMNLPNEFKQKIFSIMDQKERYSFKEEPIVVKKDLGKGIFGKIKVFLIRVRELKKEKKESIDTINISFGERCNLLNILTKKNKGRILTCHSILSIENAKKGFYGKVYDYFIKKTYKRADKIVVVSEIIKNDLIVNYELPEEKIIVIYNGINLVKVLDNSKEKVDDVNFEKNKVIINVGRMTYAKGQWHLLRVLSKIKEEIPNILLVIIGDYEKDNMEPILTRIIERFNLHENVKLLGYRSNPYKYMKNSDLFVLTSIFEGFGAVLVESLAVGTPIISTACGGPNEILIEGESNSYSEKDTIKSPFGKLVEKFDGKILIEEELTVQEEKIAREIILTLKSEKYDKDILYKRSKKFSIDSMMKSYENLIKEI